MQQGVYQLLSISVGLVPVLLVSYLMARSEDDPGAMWSRGATEHRRDLRRGLDVVAFIGYAVLAGRVSWLPT